MTRELRCWPSKQTFRDAVLSGLLVAVQGGPGEVTAACAERLWRSR
jgi:hypothetical protein